MAFLLVVAALLIVANAFFVVMEFALVKVRPTRVEMLARKGSPGAVLVQDMLGHLDDYLAAIQFGITVISLALGWIGEPALAALLRGPFQRLGIPEEALHAVSFGLALAVLSGAHIIFGELIPRTIGLQKADVVAMWGAYPLKAFSIVFRPFVAAMSFVSMNFLRLFGLKSAAHAESAVSEEEMRILLGESQEKEGFPLERLLLLENLFDLATAKTGEAMTHRDKIVFLSLNKTWEQNLETIRARRFSRYPLCEDGLDTVMGMIHVKDLILRTDGPPDLKRLRRDLAEIGELEPLEKLLKYFPDKGIHMALVRNSLGQVTGLLTFEDIVEELVGEVQDEFDLPSAWSLTELVLPSCVGVQLQAAERSEAILQLLGKLKAAHPQLDEPSALKGVWERELKFSSAVGRGVAVPHARLANLERPMIALGRFAKPLPFKTPDNVPVRLLFLILTPASTPVVQLKILGRIASLVTNENLRRKLLRAKTSEALYEILKTADTLLAV